ncbi:MAG: glycosyltransferase family 2 protein [Thermodesulfobacteriota bacterium]|nr:glycosyltransferase family 2 protein [Thermodesulfobacteriota bacterium]
MAEKIILSVIIPMYNEEENAAETISRVQETLDAHLDSYEIIAVNDGSTDNTLKVLDDAVRDNPCLRVASYWKNGGRGKAIRQGFSAARGRYMATIDADLSYDPEYILDMVRVLDDERDIDVVLASPYMPGGDTRGVPGARLFISRMGNWIIRFSMTEKIHTLTCIVRCYRSEVISSLDLESDGKEIHLEILSKVLAMGFCVKEIPATLRAREKGSSKFAFRSTALSHILFTVFERPALLFGILGIILTLFGLGLGIYILVLFYGGTLNPDRPLLPLLILFILGGMQVLSFGFLASQINYLRKEVLRVRRAIGSSMPRISGTGDDRQD